MPLQIPVLMPIVPVSSVACASLPGCLTAPLSVMVLLSGVRSVSVFIGVVECVLVSVAHLMSVIVCVVLSVPVSVSLMVGVLCLHLEL